MILKDEKKQTKKKNPNTSVPSQSKLNVIKHSREGYLIPNTE